MTTCPAPLYHAIEQALHTLSDAYLRDWLRLARLYPNTIALPKALWHGTEASAAFEALKQAVGEVPARQAVIDLAAREQERRSGRTAG